VFRLCCCIGNAGYCKVPVSAHQNPPLPAARPPLLSPAVPDRHIAASVVPCHGWSPPGGGYPGSGVGAEAALPASSPYPSPPLSTHGRPSSGSAGSGGPELRWSPVSDDGWACGGDLSNNNRMRNLLSVDLFASGDVTVGDFDLVPSGGGKQSALSTYAGLSYFVAGFTR